MEAELNRLAAEKQVAYNATQIDKVADIQKKQILIRNLIIKYSAIQAEYMEIIGAHAIY